MNDGAYFQKISPDFEVYWKPKQTCNYGLAVFVAEALEPNDDMATG